MTAFLCGLQHIERYNFVGNNIITDILLALTGVVVLATVTIVAICFAIYTLFYEIYKHYDTRSK